MTLVHAFGLVRDYLVGPLGANVELQRIEVFPGIWVVCGRLHLWFSGADWRFLGGCALGPGRRNLQSGGAAPVPLIGFHLLSGGAAGTAIREKHGRGLGCHW